MNSGLLSIKGRITLSAYWLSVFLASLFAVVMSMIALNSPALETFFLILMLVGFPLIVIIQGIKRMHDVDKSGWFLLIPVYNVIMLFLMEGTKGPNRYGEDPKGRKAQSAV
jgi:uncharacterized membrane protein YhaH (DUF805 family)